MAFDGLWWGVANRTSGTCATVFSGPEVASLTVIVEGNEVTGSGQTVEFNLLDDLEFGISGAVNSGGLLQDGAAFFYSGGAGSANWQGQFSGNSFSGSFSGTANGITCAGTIQLTKNVSYEPGAEAELWGGTGTTTSGPAICLGESGDIKFAVDHRPGETNPEPNLDLLGHGELQNAAGETAILLGSVGAQANLGPRGGRFGGIILLYDFVRSNYEVSPNHRIYVDFTADFFNGVTVYNDTPVSEVFGVSGENTFETADGCTGTLELERLFPKSRPTVVSRSIIVVENQPKTFTITSSDADGDFLLPLMVTSASKGTEVWSVDQTWVYTPDTNATGSDVFQLRMTDLQEDSTVATINVTIEPDFDGDGVSNPNDSDDDDDGMPDIFESANGLDSLNASDAGEDADGDGYTNLEEFEGESDPQDASSRPPAPLGWLPMLIFD